MVVFCHLTIIWNQSKQLFEKLKTYELQERASGQKNTLQNKKSHKILWLLYNQNNEK
ncbi:hypothetical protein SAMN05660862_1027 [Sphingobacterium psychroaquaticum]|uniref:Uncharacterized protein n=1 Tax=Sphingobacterium psychroaquaticum TaxID=561061 RepID=A0A1X7IN73_9SPHI|nr:hypothetical protein SAMN05660862_1027 [Sphingobacterium psychroaquaticum]